jgi:prolyl-tRNA editing enzyme YbaK/EbsC (Cys-tRNA(Pro) deacylase)
MCTMHLYNIDVSMDLIPSDAIGEHLPSHVAAALAGKEVIVFSVPDNASDTADSSARFGIPLEDCANTIVLRYKKDAAEHFAAVVTLASYRLDINGAVRLALGAKRISFASREAATEQSAMQFGGITALGLPSHWRVLIDDKVMCRQQIVMGAGVRTAKLVLRPSTLAELHGVEIAQLTGA